MKWIQVPVVVVLPLLFQLILLYVLLQLLLVKHGYGDPDYFWGLLALPMLILTSLVLVISGLIQKLILEHTFYKALIIDIGIALTPVVIVSFLLLFGN